MFTKKTHDKINRINMIKTKTAYPFMKGLILMLVTTIFSSIGQSLLKYAAISNTNYFFLNLFFLSSIICYGISAIIFILAIKNTELSSIFPLLSLSFVWVMILSYFLFHEPITTTKLGGTALIVGGVAIISAESKK